MKPIECSRPLRRLLLWNGTAVLLLLLFLLLDRFSLFDLLFVCPLHLFGLYCPTCGMTRALHSLLALDFASALRYHPLVFPSLAVLLYYEAVALLSLRAPRPPRAARWPLLLLLVLFLVFFAVRNILLLCGLDLIGDFIA